jgi:hypothetical protein
VASKTFSDPRGSGGCIELKPSMTPNIEHRVAVKTHPTKKQLINLRCKKGLTEREISAVTGIPKTTIHDTLQKIQNDPDFKDFQSNKAIYFEKIQHELVKNADHDAIKTMLNKRGMTDAAILEDKIRLIRGQSTNNTLIDVRALIMQVEDERQKTPEKSPPPIELNNSPVSSE